MNHMKNRHRKLFLEFFFFSARGWSVSPHTCVHSPVPRVGSKFRACGLCSQDLTCTVVIGWEFWVLERNIRRGLADRRGLCQMCGARYLSLSGLLVRTVLCSIGRYWVVCTTGGQLFFIRGSDWEISMLPRTGESCKENFVLEKFSNALFLFNRGPPFMFH